MLRKSSIRNYLIPGLILVALLNGLIKSITGIRYFPLALDFVILLMLVFLGLTILYKEKPRIGIIDVLVFSFITYAFIWMFHPNIPSIEAGLEGFRKFAFMASGLFIGRYWFRTTKSIYHLVNFMLVVPTIIALYGIKQFLFPTSLDFRLIDLSTGSSGTYLMGGHIRAFSTLSGPFHLGILLVGSALLIMGILISGIRRSLLLYIALIIQISSLIMTVTKSNMFALVAGSLTLVMLLTRRPLRTLIRLISLGIIIILIVYGAFLATANSPQFKTVHQGIQDLLNPVQAETFVYRLGLWQDEVLPLILESPWTGYGTGSAGEGLAFYFDGTNSIHVSAHNQYFKIIFELGIPGFLIFISFLSVCFFAIFRHRRRLKEPFLKVFNSWALAFTVGILVSGLAGSMLDAYPVNLIYWIVLGIATRLVYFLNEAAIYSTPPISTTQSSQQFFGTTQNG